MPSKPLPLDNILLTISSILITFFARKKYKLDFILSILFFFSVFTIVQVFQFQLVKNFNLFQWLLPILSFSFLIFFIRKKSKKPAPLKLSKNLQKEILLFAIFYLLFVLLLKTFIGPYDLWWPYYSRNTENTYLNGNTFFSDDLSYLGRGFTYPPAFFEFASQVTEIFQMKSFYDIQFSLHMILVFLFVITSYLLFINFKSWKQRIVAVLIYSGLSFTLMTTVAGTLHTFSFVLLNLSVIFFNSNHPIRKLSPLLLSIAFATHPLTLFLFVPYVYVANRFKIKLKSVIITGSLAVLVSLLFYIPIFIFHGLPYEIVPQQWGYLLTFGVGGITFDFQYLIPFAIILVLFGLFSRKFRFLIAITIVLFLINAYVAYRINMFISIMLAGLFPLMFGDYLKNKLIFSLVLVPLILNYFFVAVMYSGTTSWCTWGSVNSMCTSPMKYLNKYSSIQEAVAINPEFGHLEAYAGQRKVLADLYVEYADAKKFSAENNFYKNSDISYLSNYNISLFVLDDIGEKRNIVEADRIYDNGFLHIFRKL